MPVRICHKCKKTRRTNWRVGANDIFFCSGCLTGKTVQGVTDVIYFIKSHDDYVKIGYAADLYSRLSSIQTSNPHSIRLLGVMLNGDKHLEKRLHTQFAHLHYRGEWFKYTDDLVDFIETSTIRVKSSYSLRKEAP